MIARTGDARALDYEDNSIDCIVTSPPYNVGINYPEYKDNLPWSEYVNELVRPAAAEMVRVLKPGGRAWVNVPPAVPYGPESAGRVDVAMWWGSALYEAGADYRDTIVWRQDSHDGGCAWGSWLSPSAPNTRGGYELILCFFKGIWTREAPEEYKGWKAPRVELGGDWTDLTRNVWTINPSNKKTRSPVPFPIELPARCIRLSTWPGETVLDPFGGGGTTAEAADILGRVGISIDISTKQTETTNDHLTDLFSLEH